MPWIVGIGKIKEAEGDWFAVGEQGNPWTPVAVLSRADDITEIDRANANRIAAAPDLLEALRGLLADIEEYQRRNHLGGENNHWQVAARAAIAKAEGR